LDTLRYAEKPSAGLAPPEANGLIIKGLMLTPRYQLSEFVKSDLTAKLAKSDSTSKRTSYFLLSRSLINRDRFAALFQQVYGDVEIRRIRHTLFWRRDNPVTQLVPGATRRVKSSTTLGLSSAEAIELSSSLGLHGGLPNIVGLNGQISRKLGETINLSFQRQDEEELTLTNDRTGYYKLFAIWHPVQRLDIDFLANMQSLRRLGWFKLTSVSFAEDSSVQLTSTDIPVRA
jgi:hypothetical protein